MHTTLDFPDLLRLIDERSTVSRSSCPPSARRLSPGRTSPLPPITTPLAFYGRVPLDSLELDGNRNLFHQLVDWDPER